MCQDLHFVLINTIVCITCGTGCEFLIFEMPFHSNCIPILHYYVKWAKSFEKYDCLICEQHFVNSTIFSRFLCARITKIKGTPKSKKVKLIFDVEWKRPWNESPTRATQIYFTEQPSKSFQSKLHYLYRKSTMPFKTFHCTFLKCHHSTNPIIGCTKWKIFCYLDFLKFSCQVFLITIKCIQSNSPHLMLICS